MKQTLKPFFILFFLDLIFLLFSGYLRDFFWLYANCSILFCLLWTLYTSSKSTAKMAYTSFFLSILQLSVILLLFVFLMAMYFGT
ncbi:Uncharacterised protein [Streptococcus merionis]|uniref:Uncharacterized protein n=1 Tax=Streptococcus merionis TaxID=400065 RepID=A0A239SUE7_9STRE|nr:Uncharacterised protein [Streptococcus merionis]